MSHTFTIDIRRAESRDAEAIAAVHDAAWRYAYDGIIPAKELARIVARRGPRWWDRAIRRGTAVLVIEVGGAIWAAFALALAEGLGRGPARRRVAGRSPAMKARWARLVGLRS